MITRWFSFFVLVAAVVALASFGGFGAPGSVETGSAQGDAAKVLVLSLLAVAVAGFVGWMAQRNQQRSSRSRSSLPPARVAPRPRARPLRRVTSVPVEQRSPGRSNARPPRPSEGPSGLR